eukprot:TRINITY_DN5382_c0_g1_i4.p1 TRINITY_DN5382_c0_g1~~TRINITY_DN5382_c0_g1_i4.p1  ORF type:complete len:560 (+),score=58.64 TRINITY_DN5382_c0_g1_i4:132-1811(+)
MIYQKQFLSQPNKSIIYLGRQQCGLKLKRRKGLLVLGLCGFPRQAPGNNWTQTLNLSPGEDDGDLEGGSSKNPLKVNRDLLLWKAREYRNLYSRCNDAGKRRSYLSQAEKSARRVMTLDPQDGRGYVSLAHILKLQGRFQAAADVYQEGCAATQGGNAHIWTNWGHLEAQRGKMGKARTYFDAAITASPEHTSAWHAWAMLEKGQGDYMKARDLLIKGVKVCHQKEQLYQSMALLAMELGLVEEARQWFQEGQSLDNADMCYSWAVLEAQQSNFDECEQLFEHALEVNPKSRNAYLTYGMWQRQQGQFDKARKLFQIGCLHNPGDGLLLSAWAQLEADVGQKDDARILFQQAITVGSNHISIWKHYATMEYLSGRFEKARELFRRGVEAEINPSNELLQRTFQVWGQMECDAGDYELARELFKCVMRMKPFNEQCLNLWIDMEESTGNDRFAVTLRSFRVQQRAEVELPSNFTTLPQSPICPILRTIIAWVSQFQNQRQERMAGSLRDFDWVWLKLGLQSGQWDDIINSVGCLASKNQQLQQPSSVQQFQKQQPPMAQA